MSPRPAVLALAFALVAGHAPASPPPPRAAGAIGALTAALNAGDGARAAVFAPMAGPLGSRIAEWQHLRSAGTDLAALEGFLAAHAHWPALDQIQRRAEGLLGPLPDDRVLAFFAARAPLSTGGWVVLARALASSGATDAALRIARRLWLNEVLDEGEAVALLDRFGPGLADLHLQRLDAMLWQGAAAEAQRLIPLVPAGPAALAQARLALQAQAEAAETLIAAVPQDLADDPGLAFDRFAWRMAREEFDAAAALLAAREETALGRAEAWATGRQRLARRAFLADDHRLAYALAAPHGLTEGAVMVDLEWLAGFVALRHLDRPEDARRHFARLRDRVTSPISLARGAYFEALAYDALGQPEQARASLDFAAQHQTAFYGQLAAERLGLPLDEALIRPAPNPDWRATRLAESDLLAAAILLHRAGQWHEARRFTMHLTWGLTDPAEMGALADLWLARGEPNFALNIAKHAVLEGHVLMPAYFPLTPLASQDLSAPADLVLAVARRESEFDPRVTSHADARGLLQVLPATGALTARRLGLPFDEARLLSDPDFNALLGAAYLDEQIDRFGAYALVAAAYNAGPGRPNRWIGEFGDPRDPGTDPVDWVERIPFTETRNYVMRVLEAVVIYRAILTGDRTIRLTALLRGD